MLFMVFAVRGTVLSTCHVLTHLILTVTYNPHLTDEVIEAEGV